MNAASDRPTWFVLTRHWLSLAGVALVTTAGLSWLFVLPLQIRGHVANPYIGVIVFLILPIIFFCWVGADTNRRLPQQKAYSSRIG